MSRPHHPVLCQATCLFKKVAKHTWCQQVLCCELIAFPQRRRWTCQCVECWDFGGIFQAMTEVKKQNKTKHNKTINKWFSLNWKDFFSHIHMYESTTDTIPSMFYVIIESMLTCLLFDCVARMKWSEGLLCKLVGSLVSRCLFSVLSLTVFSCSSFAFIFHWVELQPRGVTDQLF